MTRARESMGRTLAVAGGVALFCSLFVSTAVYWLRPIQAAYLSIERNRAIVTAAGIAADDVALSDREVVDRFLTLELRIVDLEADAFAGIDAVDPEVYDYREAIDVASLTVPISRDSDIAALGRRPRAMPAYLLFDGPSLQRIVLPVYGRGMWSTIHGFVGLGPDLKTVTGVRFHEHGETPGIGDRIQNPEWTARWRGKRMYADDGRVVLRIGGTGSAGPAGGDRVDAITGATVTVSAVDRLVRFWFGDDGYGPFLAGMRAGGR
jgi:Na+-transporting NADH:ubiquinone oxidoreductase subunit C